MAKYDPSTKLNPEDWLALDEYERTLLVQDFHDAEESDLDEKGKEMHALIHVIVENQIAMEIEPVPETANKLTRQGLDRHEAIHAIGAVLSEDIFDLMKGNIAEFSPKKYRRKLEKLTVKSWKKGQY